MIGQWNLFFVLHHLTNGRFVLAIQPGNLCIRFFFSISIIARNFTFSLMERTSQLLLGLEALPASPLLRLGDHYYGKGSEHKHCSNTATNSNSKNARSRIVASLRWSVDTGTNGDESSTGRVWAAGFHHVMARCRLTRVLKLMNVLFI